MTTIQRRQKSNTFREKIDMNYFGRIIGGVILVFLLFLSLPGRSFGESLPQYLAGVMVKSYDEKRAKALEKFEEIIGKYIKERAHLILKLKALTYEDLSREIKNGRIDFIWGYGHIVSMELYEKYPIVPFIAPTLGEQKRPTFKRLLILSKGVKAKPESLRGKRLAFIGDEAWGFELLLLRLWFKEKLGVNDLSQFFTLRGLQSNEGFFIPGSRRGSVYSIIVGEADVAISHEFEYLTQEKLTPNAIKEKVEVASFFNSSEEFYEAPAFARKGLPPKDMEALIQTLLRMSEDPEGRQILISSKISGFVKVSDQDYRKIKDLIEQKKKYGL